MIIIPDMIGLTLHLHSGKEFTPLEIRPEMIGHYIGELVITNQKVVHGTPGIGASRSSMYVPWTTFWFVIDRKSTRLNSSHDQISYAVFCLKKKNSIQSTPGSTC